MEQSLKKNIKKGQTQQDVPYRKKQVKNSFIAEAQKPNFDSEDSEGSDISYQSSIQSEPDIDIGRVDYFKQEMGRFFINYPELINHDIIDRNDQFDDEDQVQSDNNNGKIKKKAFNKNWGLISNEILNEAKDSSSFLESLSRRIALYRSKVQQEDIIDLLLKQEKNIMKEIELQINQRKKQTKGNKNTQNLEGVENTYFSWRKKKEIQNRLNLSKHDQSENRAANNIDLVLNQHLGSNDRFHKSENKKNKIVNSPQSRLRKKTTFQNPIDQTTVVRDSIDDSKKAFQQSTSNQFQNSSNKLGANKKFYKLNRSLSKQPKQNQAKFSTIQKENKINNSSQNYWKHLVNFEARTQAGRQLCELIRKTNSPNDDLGIKKTIMTFLSRSKDMVQNEVILKSTISQKIQKLYNDDSKQLLMFYPTKMYSTVNKDQGTSQGNNILKKEAIPKQFSEQSQNKLFQEGEMFMKILDQIVQGPLMKYWMTVQENKL